MPTVSMRSSSHGGSAARRYSRCPMAERNVYLHEVIDIVGEGAMRYMEHTVGFNADAAADRGLELVGTWYTMGSTGRWPQVVNMWECVDGWSGWRRLMEATNLRRTTNPELNEWWQEALKSRTGGFDRLLGAAPGCPSLADLRAGAVSGSVFVPEISEVQPGAALDYLAADVVKVEPPQGDYVREMTWPIVEGESLMHLHIHRGKRSVTLDLRNPDAVEVYKDLVRGADAVVEAMRPGALERRGLGYERLKDANPQIVFCTLSGYGMTGPYRDLPAHGIAFDTWAGVVSPAYDDDGTCYMPEHPSIGIHAGPLLGAFALLAGVTRARATGEGCQIEVAQSDAAAYMDWYRIETWKAYERPESEVTGNPSDDSRRCAPAPPAL